MGRRVAVTTSVILSWPILRRAPGGGSSLSPSIRLVANRMRPTVTRVVLNRLAMAGFVMPLAASTIEHKSHRHATSSADVPAFRVRYAHRHSVQCKAPWVGAFSLAASYLARRIAALLNCQEISATVH
jgi:hypothetical protein